MGQTKKLLRLTVNLGGRNSLARILIEQWIKVHGVGELSEYIRNLIICDLAENPQFAIWKLKKLKYDYKETCRASVRIMKARSQFEQKLNEAGINPDDVRLEMD